MESFPTPPFSTGIRAMTMIKASELDKISEALATELVQRLDRFNAEHPEPNMSTESSAPINRSQNELPSNPLQLRNAFQSSFCRYVASRCIIVPG